MDCVYKPIPDVELFLVSLKFVGYVTRFVGIMAFGSNLFCKSKLVTESIFYSYIYFNIGCLIRKLICS